MDLHIMVILVKHNGGNGPKELMDTICSYHLTPAADKNRIIDPVRAREDMIKALPSEIKEFQDSERSLMYFGLSGEELEKGLGVRIFNGGANDSQTQK
jgi:hypothetical protein